MNHVDTLEAEAIYIFREVAGQFRRPVLLFSGGKDSTVLIHLALKAFYPMPVPFPVMHVDTGHNFEEALRFRDEMVAKHGLQLIVRKVADTIRERGLEDATGKFPSRNVLQSRTLLDAIREFGFDACIGGGRRDEEKARAKERIFSVRDEKGAWRPYNQRPELWDVYTCPRELRSSPAETPKERDEASPRPSAGEREVLTWNTRVFPISNWSELDVWHYVRREGIGLPSIYFAHERDCISHNGRLVAVSEYINVEAGDGVLRKRVRYRTVGDMTCTAAVESEAVTMDEVIYEIENSALSERGETRMDDQLSDAAMEDRKMKGYF